MLYLTFSVVANRGHAELSASNKIIMEIVSTEVIGPNEVAAY
jgi:hypothetical protein